MNEVELINNINEWKHLFDKLYYLYSDKDEKGFPKRRYEGKLYPYIFLDVQFGIEVTVTISTVNLDVKHEEDEYLHALRHAVIPLVDNPECLLSEQFHRIYVKHIFKQKLFFEDMKKYVYPYRVFEKGEGKLRDFISTSFSEESEFSYRHFLASILAHKDKENMYLKYKNKILISEEEFHEFMDRLYAKYLELENIYASFYKDVLCPIYDEIEQYYHFFIKIKDIVKANQLASIEDINYLDKIASIRQKIESYLEQVIANENLEKYILEKVEK